MTRAPVSREPAPGRGSNIESPMRNFFCVDADSHVLEPPDLWERYLEPRFAARAIKIRSGPEGEQLIVVNGLTTLMADGISREY